MKILSEKTNETYATIEECLAAEKAHDEMIAAEKARVHKLNSERKERAKEVEEAYNTYQKLLKAFIEDYGGFHMTLREGGPFDDFDGFGGLLDFVNELF